MEVQRTENSGKGMFFVTSGDEVHARMTYHMASPGEMVIEHTEVDEALRGRDVGYHLVEAAVNYARAHHIYITVWCPFAKKVFDKKPDWHDVLKP
ncbi:MAG TPA: GNAT family N-acetyltransferase [Chitinophagaceae bacterium]